MVALFSSPPATLAAVWGATRRAAAVLSHAFQQNEAYAGPKKQASARLR